ncbi:50S ribosomal protein L6 [Hugenholtzia roseola]|uniref:50S ribosomal protein L6 n=1 Tax=Hugenholtzia roseola TaxID=1002 RepID=UPI00041F18D7|nr:50S ribosomal protein L6 [Hugenholtzia roseola]
MSRIGKKPISIPNGVSVTIDKDVLTVKGPKGELKQTLHKDVSASMQDGEVVFERHAESKDARALHGLYRSLVQNMVKGVTEGYKLQLELVGVGYKAATNGQVLELNLGYSHAIFFQIPNEVKVAAEMVKGKNPIVTLESNDKQLIGHIAAKIRSLRKVEPYQGKGVKFVGENIRRKAGKAGGKKK